MSREWVKVLIALTILVGFVAYFLWAAYDTSCKGRFAWQC